jgi:lactate dehydrogenase-like 2-hydroxyacid dehydrogenase
MIDEPKPAVLVLAPLADFLLEPLARLATCVWARTPSELEVAKKHESAPLVRAAVGAGSTVVTAELLESFPALDLVAINGVGYDGVDLTACRARGVRVTNTPDVLTDDVADLAVALMLMTSRCLLMANRSLHEGRWAEGASRLTHKLSGSKAGILGLGRIGKAIAQRLAAFDITVGYHGRQRQEVEMRFFENLEDMAHWCDFLVVACPGGPGTRHLVSKEVLAALGADGTLINIARGPVVDEQALVKALREKVIRSAGLDVFEHEPQVPEELLAMEQVVLLPHVGSATHETRGAMARLVLENVEAHFSGMQLVTPVV